MSAKEVISPVNIKARKEIGIRPGDTVRVSQKILEKGKTRLQAFEGLVLMVKHGTEAGATFTVRKVASGVGVEKTFPLYSPMIDKIEVIKRSKVRRAKLYHIREKAAKEIRRSMRNAFTIGTSTGSDIGEKEKAVADAAEAVRVAEETAKAEVTQTEELKEEIPADASPTEESKE
jgi:large subunit ribosomal protein L19